MKKGIGIGVLVAAALLTSCGSSEGAGQQPTTSVRQPPEAPAASRLREQDCGPGVVLKDGVCVLLSTTTSTSTTTTQPRTTTTVLLRGSYLSAEAKQAVIDCSAGQAYHAAMIVNGSQATSFMKDMRNRLCEIALDRLDAEAPTGSNPVRDLAVKLAGNSADLAFWELSVTLGTEVSPGLITGLMPNQAIGWEEETRGIVGSMPTGG
jgi:hypothetical protein